MHSMTTTHLRRPQDAVVNSKAAPQQHEHHGPLQDGVTHTLRLHLSVTHEMSCCQPTTIAPQLWWYFPLWHSLIHAGQQGSSPRCLSGNRQPCGDAPGAKPMTGQKPILCSPTHVPAVWAGTTFGRHANPSLCCNSPPRSQATECCPSPWGPQPPLRSLENLFHC